MIHDAFCSKNSCQFDKFFKKDRLYAESNWWNKKISAATESADFALSSEFYRFD